MTYPVQVSVAQYPRQYSLILFYFICQVFDTIFFLSLSLESESVKSEDGRRKRINVNSSQSRGKCISRRSRRPSQVSTKLAQLLHSQGPIHFLFHLISIFFLFSKLLHCFPPFKLGLGCWILLLGIVLFFLYIFIRFSVDIDRRLVNQEPRQLNSERNIFLWAEKLLFFTAMMG